jgi:hypothetical protein
MAVSASRGRRLAFGANAETLDRADIFHEVVPVEVQVMPPCALDVVKPIPKNNPSLTIRHVSIASLFTPTVSGAATSLAANVGVAPPRGFPPS